jgi:hypothetical protein
MRIFYSSCQEKSGGKWATAVSLISIEHTQAPVRFIMPLDEFFAGQEQSRQLFNAVPTLLLMGD